LEYEFEKYREEEERRIALVELQKQQEQQLYDEQCQDIVDRLFAGMLKLVT